MRLDKLVDKRVLICIFSEVVRKRMTTYISNEERMLIFSKSEEKNLEDRIWNDLSKKVQNGMNVERRVQELT